MRKCLSRLLSVLAATVGCSQTLDEARPIAVSDAVASYEGGVVTSAELQREVSRLPPGIRERLGTDGARASMAGALVDKRLLLLEGKRRGLADSTDIRSRVRAFEDQLVIAALLAEEDSRLETPSDEELRTWFEAHKSEVAEPVRLRVARVLVEVPQKASKAFRDEAWRRARRLHARSAKEPIAKVALEGDGPEKSKEGSLGWLSAGEFPDPSLARAAFDLKVGETSALLDTLEGPAFVKVLERRDARIPSFAEVREVVRQKAEPARKRKALEALLERLRTFYKVQVNVAGLAQPSELTGEK